MPKNFELNLKTYQGKGKYKLLVNAKLINGNVEFEGDSSMINNLMLGLENPNKIGDTILPIDGEIFLDAMLNYFDSPYLFATKD